MIDENEIRKQGIKLIDEFSQALEGVPETEQTHYVVEMKNVIRQDGESEVAEGFAEKFKKQAPKTSGDYIVCEKGVD